eukprot:comp22425_c0_seq1/m.54891 comp22425_c0_seq1/g.54891  ORF comp22425_c0_seq1/g.54891 comp22425_c0_seq1/m.54891 type:complete len:323 (+) comp22425_c0_seq1:1219-2187(+)
MCVAVLRVRLEMLFIVAGHGLGLSFKILHALAVLRVEISSNRCIVEPQLEQLHGNYSIGHMLVQIGNNVVGDEMRRHRMVREPPHELETLGHNRARQLLALEQQPQRLIGIPSQQLLGLALRLWCVVDKGLEHLFAVEPRARTQKLDIGRPVGLVAALPVAGLLAHAFFVGCQLAQHGHMLARGCGLHRDQECCRGHDALVEFVEICEQLLGDFCSQLLEQLHLAVGHCEMGCSWGAFAGVVHGRVDIEQHFEHGRVACDGCKVRWRKSAARERLWVCAGLEQHCDQIRACVFGSNMQRGVVACIELVVNGAAEIDHGAQNA